MKALAEMTPVEVDTILADLYDQIGIAQFDLHTAAESLHYAVKDKRLARPGPWGMTTSEAYKAAQRTVSDPASAPWDSQAAARAMVRYDAAVGAVEDLREQARPYNEEYARRPWSRAWIVLNSNGHAHRSMDCSTCFASTRFGWLVELSGKTEEEIVVALGSDACTVCYPTAPVETAGPRTAFSKQEHADREAREALDAEKAAKLEAKIAKSLSLDGSTVKISWYREGRDYRTGEARFFCSSKELKTLRAAELWYVEAAAGRAYDDPTPEVITEVLTLMAAKRDTTPEAEAARLAPKVEKKRSSQ